MWASSAATEIMKTPRSKSIETSTRSRRTLIGHSRSGALYAPIGSNRRTGSSSVACFRQQIGPGVGAVEGLGEPVGRLLLLLAQLFRHLDLEPVADVALAAPLCLRCALAAQ